MASSDLFLHFLAELARRGALVLCPDLPGHGRSDGELTYVPDWWVRHGIMGQLRVKGSGKPCKIIGLIKFGSISMAWYILSPGSTLMATSPGGILRVGSAPCS